MEKIITEQKKAYKAAYAWAIKVQKACLLKEVDIEVDLGWCKENAIREDLTPYTVEVSIWDEDESTWIRACWATFYPDFEEKKLAIEAYLAKKGITIKK